MRGDRGYQRGETWYKKRPFAERLVEFIMCYSIFVGLILAVIVGRVSYELGINLFEAGLVVLMVAGVCFLIGLVLRKATKGIYWS